MAGERLRARRRELKKTGPEVAEQAEISQQHYRNLENGHNPRATYPVLERIARALEVQPAYVIAPVDSAGEEPSCSGATSHPQPTHPPNKRHEQRLSA